MAADPPAAGTDTAARPGPGHLFCALYWLGPPLLLMAAIYWMGGDRAAASETRSLLEALLQRHWPWLYERLPPGALVELNVLARKTGHFVVYALLGALDLRAVYGVRGAIGRNAALGAWTAALIWACVDETHQSFSVNRGATVEDVLLDGAGAAAGVWLYLLSIRRSQGRGHPAGTRP